MFEEWVFGGGKLVGWPVHTDFLRPTVDTPTYLQLSRFNTAIHVKVRSYESSPDVCYFAEHGYFKDKFMHDLLKP